MEQERQSQGFIIFSQCVEAVSDGRLTHLPADYDRDRAITLR